MLTTDLDEKDLDGGDAPIWRCEMNIIGRKYEKAQLKIFFESGKPEFIAVTGRRRVGKTYLIREYFADSITFYFSGMVGKNITNSYQLQMFDKAIEKCGGQSSRASKCWADAFDKLRDMLIKPADCRQVVFIDELPWLDAPRSDFLPALDYFWNIFASARSDIMLIVCGSAASWMVNNLFENRGGLHNRITRRMYLAPFSLSECEEYITRQGIVMNRYQIAELYMIFGGIPYYLSMLDKGLGHTQNVDKLLFVKNAPLKNEFYEVFRSLYRSPDRHIKIVRALTGARKGYTRDEIIKAADIPGGGNLTKTLCELEQCGFIEKYSDFAKKSKDSCYRLVDPFTLFWLKYVADNKTKDEYFWTNLLDDGGRRAWCGYAFEMLCLLHIAQIKQKLGISGISTHCFSWRSKKSTPGAQIDLVISRKDGVINLCEMKYTLHPYTIDKDTDEVLHRKRIVFLSETGTRGALHATMITTYGLTDSGYRASVQSEVTLDDLFALTYDAYRG